MAKLYFKYGAMGSSKSAQALITQFNYEELGMTVWLINVCPRGPCRCHHRGRGAVFLPGADRPAAPHR